MVMKYSVDLPITSSYHKDYNEALTWTIANFGEPGYNNRWTHLSYTFHFKYEEDRNWFILRWT